MGARFDAAIDGGNNTRMRVGGLGAPALSSNDSKTVANELRTHLIVTGNDTDGKGMFSFGDLLGSGMASDQGRGFVDVAVEKIEKVRADVSALLALDTKPSGLDDILSGQWNKLREALDDIFGTNSTGNTTTFAVRGTAPREEDILDDINDVLDALSSEASFVAATADGGGGVFASRKLGTGLAADTFNRVKWSAEATMGMTGSTRYGAVVRKASDSANEKPTQSGGSDFGAFSYATMQETVRTADAAAVSLTGIASYSGGTRAVSGSGKHYAGQMDLQVRFKANSVSGVVSGLEDSEGLPWMHNFAPVDRIVLDDGKLQRNAQWKNTNGEKAQVFYTADSGLLRPVGGLNNTFSGILLGRGADAGSEANGVWSVGTSGNSDYLAGGFGVVHVADASRPVPAGDDGSKAGAKLFSMALDGNASTNMTSATIGDDGMLTVKQRRYGWMDSTDDNANNPTYQPLGAVGSETLITAKFDLAEMANAGAGTETTVNGPKHVDQVISVLTKERDLLSTLQGLNSADTQDAERAAWQRVQNAVHYHLLGGSEAVDLDGTANDLPAQSRLPLKLAKNYDGATNPLESEAEAIDLINRALDALSSNANLAEAFNPDGTGIFDHFDSGTPDDASTDERENEAKYVNNAKTKIANRTFANMRAEREHQVIATLGTTSYTRFGVWRRQSTQSAIQVQGGVIRDHGGPGAFAYSPLDPTNAGTTTNPGFPPDGSATYTGETVAVQNTTLLTGTVRVDVSWTGTLTDASFANDNTGNLGTMSLTISGLASAAGDPLSLDGNDTAGSLSPGNEIADIVLSGFTIMRGSAGDNADDLIVGTRTAVTPATTPETFRYSEIGGTSSPRVRFTDQGMEDNAEVASSATTIPNADTDGASVKALFVGQGVDGPLGVIGTWSYRDATVGRIDATGTTVMDLGALITGAFGAEAP